MGGMIGVLSTVILVSTVCTLIFAIGAYVVSRKSRDGVGVLDEPEIPGTDVADQFPQTSHAPQATLFKRVQPTVGTGELPGKPSTTDDEYLWK